MLAKCNICCGTKKIRQLGFMHSECKACDAKGMVKKEEVKPTIEPEITTEVKARGKKGNKAS